nr:TetR/AcrR family transcriptional regulator [Mesorhizobium sp. GR13]
MGAAKGLFAKSGLDNITMESIAEIAGVSSMTVHNYYGTKSGVLLALVADSDAELLETFANQLDGRHDDLLGLVLAFAEIICDHTLSHLDKAIWRQVIAASVAESDPRFGTLYNALDDRLADVLIHEIERLQIAGRVNRSVSAYDLGKALFYLQNMRFIQFISADSVTKFQVIDLLRRDISALFAASLGCLE